MRFPRALLWAAPLILHASDALAWGLHTHVYFAQLLVWAVPLADERFRRALARFPAMCLAGTCLPDVALFSRLPRHGKLADTHQWAAAARMLKSASTDEERAMAVGFAAHLLCDVVAHNYFVPAHQALWFRTPVVAHAACEWAMDAHVGRQAFAQPAELMTRYRDALSDVAGARLDCPPQRARKALDYLLRADRWLRRSRLPQIVYAVSRKADRAVVERFDEYIRETAARLGQINALIRGETPVWLPEPHADRAASIARRESLAPHYSLLLPPDFFRDRTTRRE